MSEVDTSSIEYYGAVLFVQAVAEDGKLSKEEATAVEQALGGFLEGLESEGEAIDYLNYISGEITENTESYIESLKEAIAFFGEQKKEIKSSILGLMEDIAGTDGISAKEKKFFQNLKSTWKI